MYRCLEHVEVNEDLSKGGVFAISRSGQDAGNPALKGFIKRRWKLTSPPESEIDGWLWFLYASNEITLFDVKVDDTQKVYCPEKVCGFAFNCPFQPFASIDTRALDDCLRDYWSSTKCFALTAWIERQIDQFRVADIT